MRAKRFKHGHSIVTGGISLQHFKPILISIRISNNTILQILKDKTYTYEVIPCFLRMFESRWYLICEYLNHKATRVLALERMQPLVIGEKEGLPSPNITPAYFYQDCFGIIRDDKTNRKRPTLKIYGNQADYIRSVPLRSSQEEPEATLDYEIFQLSRHFGLNY